MIQAFFKLFEESDDYREKKMADRVASNSIEAQKLADSFQAPALYDHSYYLSDVRLFTPTIFSKQIGSNSYFKGREGTYCNSFQSVHFYNEKARARRDRLIKELEGQKS